MSRNNHDSKLSKDEIDKYIDNIIEKNMVDIMSDRFGKYSKYIIQQRAIPDARDGLKPVQRRILFSMWNLHLKNNQPFKKSARIVGDVIGRYHPHGDSSIYEALVRMCQEWKSNYPLIEMHGNKGSIDDDPAAAMRYTESRLEKISELLLKDLDRNVVSMAPNFDDTEYEPTVLPSLIPNLLINGAKGIAAGFATEIPPHNLNEIIDATIKLIKKPTTKFDELREIVKGPDFPTGGIINGIDGIDQAFKTGQGKIILSSRYRFVADELQPDKIVGIEIYEIPFGVIKSKLVADIDALVIDKAINGVKEVRDQSNREGISIYLELDQEANAQPIINYLMSKTDLRISYNYNMVAIYENAPKLMNLEMLLYAYLSHLRDINTKGIQYDLQKHKIRLEIVEGFIRVAEISDEVIRVIKNSDNSKKGVILALEQTFGFTNLQATAIAELRLYKLSRMDQLEYQAEKQQLEELIARCNLLLSDSSEFDKFLISQLKEIQKTYGIPRRTQISDEKVSNFVNTKLLAKNEDFYFFISAQGYIKRISKKARNANEFDTYKLKENDAIFYYDKINSLSKLIFFTNLGNYFILDAHTLKECNWKDLGDHVSSMVALDNNEIIIRIMEIASFKTYANLILLTKLGSAKKINLTEFMDKQVARKRSCIMMRPNDELVDVKVSNLEKMLFILITGGIYYFFDDKIIPEYSSKAAGISLIKLEPNSYIEAFNTFKPTSSEKLILVTNKGQFKRCRVKDIKPVGRNSRGKIFYFPTKSVKSQVIGIENWTKELNYLFTNGDNQPEKFDLKKIQFSDIKDPLSTSRFKFANNIGYLIQPYKIHELSDLDTPKEMRDEIRKFHEDNLDLTLSAETVIFKHDYLYDDAYYDNNLEAPENDIDFKEADASTKTENTNEFDDDTKKITIVDKMLEGISKSNKHNVDVEDDNQVDIDFTTTQEASLDIGKIFEKEESKPKEKKVVTKESVDKKIAAMESLDLDSILGKTDDFKIWKKKK